MKDPMPAEYRNTFTTVAGAKVLEDLRKTFHDCPLTRSDAHHTAMAVGGHSVIVYILDMLEDKDAQ